MELTLDNLLLALIAASNSNRGVEQKSAEQQIKEWESHKGYHYYMQQVYNNRSLSLQIRWLAVICLKNGVDKYWRSTRVNAISKEEKNEIRKNLFGNLDESNNQLTIQNAHTVARIARFDFPVEWPTLFEDFIQILENCNVDKDSRFVIRVHNLLIILNQVLKNIASARIGKARAAMQAKVPLLFPHLVKFYTLFFNESCGNGDYNISHMEVGYITLKNIRRAVVDGYPHAHREQAVQDFFELSLQHLQKLLVAHESNQMELLERYIKCYVKLYFNLANDNPTGFILMKSSKNILLTLLSLLQQKAQEIYNLDVNDGSDLWEKVCIKSLLMLKKLTNFTFKKGSTVIIQKNDKHEVENSIQFMSSNFFTPDLLQNLVELLISWYMKLRPCDIESWSTEPEEWVTEELQSSWEYQIRPCAENYFQDLAIYFKDFLTEFILRKIETSLSDSSIDILTKDSILAVFQLSATAIHNDCNFHNLLTTYFIPQALQTSDPNYKIIKRRICLIINEWALIQCTPETREEIYKLLLTLLNGAEPTNDKVVRLTALQSLRFMIDDWEFRKFNFEPFLNETVYCILSILESLKFTECKIVVIDALSLLIARMNPLIDEKILVEIMKMVPAMWESSNSPDQMIIKTSLLRLMKDLTKSLNGKSTLIHEMVIPLIAVCCDPASDLNSLLSEEGLELWGAILTHLPLNSPIPDILLSEQYLQYILHGLMTMTEILPTILAIVRSYTLLEPALFATEFGVQFYKIIGGYLSTMRDDILVISCQILELVIIQQESIESQSIKSLVESGLFSELVKYVVRDSDNPHCEIKVSMVLLRIAKANAQFFLYCLIQTSGDAATKIIFYRLITNLFRFNKMAYDSKVKKIFLLGLLSFYQPQFFTDKICFNVNASDSNDIPKDDVITYQIEQLSQQDAISTILGHYFTKMLDMIVLFLEENKETGSDCASYHKAISYDDGLKFIEIDGNNEQDLDEYAKEYALPNSGEDERFTKLSMTKDMVHTVATRTQVAVKLESVLPILCGLVSNERLEEVGMFMKT